MLSYGELVKDLKKAKDLLKKSSASFGKVARKCDKPALFGEKFHWAVIERGAVSKQLKEAKAQLGQKFKGCFLQEDQQNRSGPPVFASPLLKVQPLPQPAGYQTQTPIPKTRPHQESFFFFFWGGGGGWIEVGMYTSTVVKEPRPVCTSLASVQHDVQHFNSVYELTSSAT